MVTRPGFAACLKCRWLPRVVAKIDEANLNVYLERKTCLHE